MMGWNGYGFGWWGMILGAVIMFAFWAGIIALVVWGIRSLSRHSSEHSTPGQAPLDIARARYARGEITKEQFEQLKKDLTQ